MDTSGQINEQVINDIYKKIVDQMLSSLNNGLLSSEEAEDVSFFVLESLDNASSQSYLEAFLEELARRWPCFSPLLTPIREEQSAQEDQKNIESVANELKALTQ